MDHRLPIDPLGIVALTALALSLGGCREGADGQPELADSEARSGAASAISYDGGAPPMDLKITYTVAPGDTLGLIAERNGTTIETLMSANGLSNPDALFVGQELDLRVVPEREGPNIRTLPDSEIVYGPAYVGFDTKTFIESVPGYLAGYSEMVDGRSTTGAQIVERVARENSVGPRALLAIIEARGGWVTGTPQGLAVDYPAGLVDGTRSGLWWQLSWLANQLNSGFYDWKTRGNRVLRLADGTVLAGHEGLGAGPFAVQRAMAPQSTEAELPGVLHGIEESYALLFGDPWARALAPLIPATLEFPKLGLPWDDDERWWFTGGPHGGWAGGSAWAAVDFVPDEEARGCFISDHWATAVADGTVIYSGDGQLWLDLDGDGRRETGPAVQYLHLSSLDMAPNGKKVKAGDPLGHPSCEGGMSEATHLHLARTYDGEWLAAGGGSPLVLGDWRAESAPSAYDGRLLHSDGREREACECRERGYNDIPW